MSKLIIFEFRCSACNNVFDELTSSEVHALPCPACGGRATRIISAPRIDWQAFVHGPTAHEPSVDKWDKMRKKKMDIEQRKLRDHGTYD